MEQDNLQEKIAPASQKKLQRFKKQGYVAKSYDLSNFLVLLAGVLCMLAYFYISNDFYKLAKFNFNISREVLYSDDSVLNQLALSFGIIIKSIMPYFIILLFTMVFSYLIPSKFNFSFDLLQFKTDRINLFKGLIRIFSMKNLIEIFILIIKVIFILSAVFGYFYMFKNYLYINDINNINPSILQSIYYILITALFLVSLVFIISLFDFPYRIYKYNKDTAMTHEELREEQKSSEGNSQIKSARKRAYNKLLK